MVDTDDTRHTTDDGKGTVWHKHPTGELIKNIRNTVNRSCEKQFRNKIKSNFKPQLC